jgi:excisionase family DNA binding protein
MGTDRRDEFEQLLTTREVATLLHVSVRYDQRQVADGRLRALALGSGPRQTLRIRESDLETWLARHVHERNTEA